MDRRAHALDLLRRLADDDAATFHEGQWEAIDTLVTHRRRALVVQRTGWGKSAVYFIATRLRRAEGSGATVLISPLLALMRNQIEAATRVGVRAVTINSANPDEWAEIEDQVQAGQVDLLLISPERLNNAQFRRNVLPQLVRSVGLFVVDEAHCISDWGHDFRPDYRRIRRVLDALPADVPVLCTTATANDRVVADIVDQLGDDLHVIRGQLGRESLRLAVLDLAEPATRLAWLALHLPALPGSGIVYCLTIADVGRVTEWLRRQGIDAVSYTGDGEPAERVDVERRLLANDVKVVVATSALGMGFDKPDLAFVVHYQSPGSPIAYYQQVGRAGRATPSAEAILLRGHEDGDIQDFFIATAFPPQSQAEAVVALLEERIEPLSVGQIEQAVNISRGRIEAMLKVLDVEGVVESVESRWRRTPMPWAYPAERVAKITAQRRAEQQAMRDYAVSPDCRMTFLRTLLDDQNAPPCGRCDRCRGDALDGEVPTQLVGEATAFLRSSALVLDPRKQWIRGTGRPRVPLDEQASSGRALGILGDGGWGSVVRRARALGEPFGGELVDAAVRVAHGWLPVPAPEWLTVVPSATDGGRLDDFARRLAAALGLPFVGALSRRSPAPPQSEMANSVQQLRNVEDAFTVEGVVPNGAVVLLDDVVQSGWTMTVCASLLRRSGAKAVHPFVLAKGGGG